MSNNMVLPDGTLFVGKKAFVPKADGSGYKKVSIDELTGIEVLSDSLAEPDSEDNGAVTDIKFDVDYGFADKIKSAKKAAKANKTKIEKADNPKIISV